MNKLIEAAKDVLDQYSKSRSYLSADIDSDVMEALRQALALPKQEPVVYVPMSVDDYRKLAKNTTMPIGYEEWETVQAVEAEVVRRMKEQGIT